MDSTKNTLRFIFTLAKLLGSYPLGSTFSTDARSIFKYSWFIVINGTVIIYSIFMLLETYDGEDFEEKNTRFAVLVGGRLANLFCVIFLPITLIIWGKNIIENLQVWLELVEEHKTNPDFRRSLKRIKIVGILIYALNLASIPIWISFMSQYSSSMVWSVTKVIMMFVINLLTTIWTLIVSIMAKTTCSLVMNMGLSAIMIKSNDHLYQLETLRIQHAKLMTSVNAMYDTLGLVLLMPIIRGSLSAITELIIIAITKQNVLTCVTSISAILKHAVFICFLIFPADQYNDSADELLAILSQVKHSELDFEIASEMRDFRNQIMYLKPKADCFGISLKRNMLITILGSIVTYIIIALQF